LSIATDLDNGDMLTVVWHSQPAYGRLTVAPGGSFEYEPSDFVGPSNRTDSFIFNVRPGRHHAGRRDADHK
jgi:acetoin utilization deacetylase AcuC-like enzyme